MSGFAKAAAANPSNTPLRARGERLLSWCSDFLPEGSVGFGIGGPEADVPRAEFAGIFRAAAQRFGYEGFYTDWQQLVADPRVEIFDNCTQVYMHVEPTLDALAALAQAGCLSADDNAYFQRSYRFLRSVEARLRLGGEGESVTDTRLKVVGHQPCGQGGAVG